jgi:hypothetical protein
MRTRRKRNEEPRGGDEMLYAITAIALWTTVVVSALSLSA